MTAKTKSTDAAASDLQLRLRKIKNGFLILTGEQVYFASSEELKTDVGKRIDKWARGADPVVSSEGE